MTLYTIRPIRGRIAERFMAKTDDKALDYYRDNYDTGYKLRNTKTGEEWYE